MLQLNMNQGQIAVLTDLEKSPSTILVVDDEVLIRFVIADYLRECGFHVLEAASAAEAIALLEAEPIIDLVFSDVQMPGEMNGFGLARWVRANRSDTPIILTSGAVQTAELGEELCHLGQIETKPYNAPALVERFRRVLGSTAAPNAPRF